jgi:hypothetical protein
MQSEVFNRHGCNSIFIELPSAAKVKPLREEYETWHDNCRNAVDIR